MKLFFSSLLFLSLILLSACSAPSVSPVKVEPTQKKVSYLRDVKPIMDKRCVVCHSCYNSPCQAKYSSFEGIDRGGSKLAVYDASRLKAAMPTRLFEDAQSTQEWREKGFFSLTTSKESNTTANDSIMIHLLHDKEMHPDVVGEYDPEHDTLSCPRDKEELEEYLDEKPNHGMPYGFPALKKSEYTTVAEWLAQGAKGPNAQEQKALETPSKNAQKAIAKFEAFLNKRDAKHQVTARYLYEHLYLAHIYFPSAKGEFFRLIRSSTPAPQKPQIIATRRVFDNPNAAQFYYRLEKIHSTIVHKTHMTFKIDDAVLARFDALFIKPKWDEKPHVMDYDVTTSTNPILEFAQIPVRSRYQFLLDNSHFIIMTFIRGPVCRGQIALNVIHDHFWVMFRDPEHDIGVLNPNFLKEEAQNLALPIADVNNPIIEVLSNAYREKYAHYYKDKRSAMQKEFPNGVGYDSIWKGNKPSDAPLLTVYRHFDSASVSKGILGEEPRTMWVIDYAQFERIYYTLVAGYDVYGNVSHQANIRRYMDYLRLEGELNFLDYMPQTQRVDMFASWYINDDSFGKKDKKLIENLPDCIVYKTKYPKDEFITHIVKQHILKSTGIAFDELNYAKPYAADVKMPQAYKTVDDYMQAIHSIARSGNNFVRFVTDHKANLIFVRVELPDGSFTTRYLVINRWHDNVNSMFFEEDTLNPKKDTMDILKKSVGSYPNAFAIIEFKDLAHFLELIKNYDGSEAESQELKRFFISRSDKKFWNYYDWFQKEYDKKEPLRGGLYDLNRYSSKVWSK